MALPAPSFAYLTSINSSKASPDCFRTHPPSSLLFPLRRRRLTLHSKKNQSLKASSSSPSISSVSPGTKDAAFMLTYLEGNSWLWSVEGVNVLVDPILVGNLDFGVPWLYDAAKKVLTNFRLENLPEVDFLLITQSLDDHCHVKTLRPLSEKLPNLPVFSTPNAESILSPLFRNVTYLEPGQTSEFEGRNGAKLNILATAGPILGPPWQRPENGDTPETLRKEWREGGGTVAVPVDAEIADVDDCKQDEKVLGLKAAEVAELRRERWAPPED